MRKTGIPVFFIANSSKRKVNKLIQRKNGAKTGENGAKTGENGAKREKSGQEHKKKG